MENAQLIAIDSFIAAAVCALFDLVQTIGDAAYVVFTGGGSFYLSAGG